jgi:glycosyltransferase involved in cell wall biosynthesis
VRVFVNAVSIREGGPRVVLIKLLSAMHRERPDLEIAVAAPPAICVELGDAAAMCRPVTVGQSPFALAKWYELNLPRAVRDWSADVLFSLTNYLPYRRLSVPTLLLEQHAGHFSPTFDRLMLEATRSMLGRLAWRYTGYWVRHSVETATVLTVQKAALADAIAARTRVPRNRIHVVPHGPGWVEMRTEEELPVARTAGPLRIGYITKAGVQKNFGTVFRAVRQLSEQGRDIRLVLTLDSRDPIAAAALAEAEASGIAHLLENVGEVPAQAISDLYDSLDIFVFASLSESFGMPMVEAMARGLCMVIADTAENREIVGAAGLAFSALDAEQLASVLRRLCADPGLRRQYARMSLQRAREFSWQKGAQGTAAALEAAVASHAS